MPKRDPYGTVKCQNSACPRTLLARDYLGYPTADTPPERIHRVWDPAGPERSVFCTCGHYTVYSKRHPDGKTGWNG